MIDLANWYWAVGGSTTDVWSSAKAASVPVSDADYVAWGKFPTPIATMEELYAVLAQSCPQGSLPTYCAFKRWTKEQGGITLASGMPIKTDDRAQAKITGVYNAQQVNPAVITPWHAADGATYDLDAAGITAMNTELLTHINNCFSISDDVLAQIEAGTITTREQIDAAFDAPMTQARKDWLKT